MVYDQYINASSKARVAVLIDPDKHDEKTILQTLQVCNDCNVSFILLGGSLISKPIGNLIQAIKLHTKLPVVLFPGSLFQVSDEADAILLLSLISGRNPEFLIGNHVTAAPILKQSNLEVIPTGYIIIDSGKITSVQYISNTLPIPSDKNDIAVATAIAGEMLGLKTIYLEAGSGAPRHVPEKLVEAVKNNINIPLIVGGGLREKHHIQNIISAGADIVVIGNSLENAPKKLYDLLNF